MRICPACNSDCASEAKFCPHCGADVEALSGDVLDVNDFFDDGSSTKSFRFKQRNSVSRTFGPDGVIPEQLRELIEQARREGKSTSRTRIVIRDNRGTREYSSLDQVPTAEREFVNLSAPRGGDDPPKRASRILEHLLRRGTRSIKRRTDGDTLHLTRTWFSPASVFYLAAVIVGAAVWMAADKTSGDPFVRNVRWLMAAPLAFVCYLATAAIVNRTHIAVGPNDIRIRHAPLWWPGSKVVDRRLVESLKVTQHWRRERISRTGGYRIEAFGPEGAIVLVAGIGLHREAQELRDALGEWLLGAGH